MGYTHYWEFKTAPAEIQDGKKLFSASVKAAKQCIKETGVTVRGGLGTGAPRFNSSEIRFNGDAATGNDCETFSISLDDGEWDFCKTSRRDYDVAVCIALLCFKHFFGNKFIFSSDGDIENGEEGWSKAKEITEKYFNNPKQ